MKYIHVRIATKEVNTGELFSEYNYTIENSKLYYADEEGNRDATKASIKLEYNKIDGYEYCIPFANLGISNESEIKAISFTPLDPSWNAVKTVFYKF